MLVAVLVLSVVAVLVLVVRSERVVRAHGASWGSTQVAHMAHVCHAVADMARAGAARRWRTRHTHTWRIRTWEGGVLAHVTRWFSWVHAGSWLTTRASQPAYTNVLRAALPAPTQCLDARAYAPSRITAASNSAHQARCTHLHNCKLRADAYRTPKHERSSKNVTSNSQN